MKKYKYNYVFSTMFWLCNMLLSFLPGIFIFILCKEPEKVIFTLGIGVGGLLFCIVVGNALNLLIGLFTKHHIYVDEDSITVKEKKILTQSMRLDDVRYIILDHGIMSKFNGEPCSINLFNEDYSENLKIMNPPFLVIREINKRCKNAQFKFNNYKWYIIWCGIFTVFSIVASVFT